MVEYGTVLGEPLQVYPVTEAKEDEAELVLKSPAEEVVGARLALGDDFVHSDAGKTGGRDTVENLVEF